MFLGSLPRWQSALFSAGRFAIAASTVESDFPASVIITTIIFSILYLQVILSEIFSKGFSTGDVKLILCTLLVPICEWKCSSYTSRPGSTEFDKRKKFSKG